MKIISSELLDESKDQEFGNSLYNIKFASTDMKMYGWKYTFYLKDAIDSCPEYVVLSDVLKKYVLAW